MLQRIMKASKINKNISLFYVYMGKRVKTLAVNFVKSYSSAYKYIYIPEMIGILFIHHNFFKYIFISTEHDT